MQRILGRSTGCHITIEDPLVSRQHARIEFDDNGVRVFDLGSRNGVRVNGAAIRGSMQIGEGDRIRIGTQELVLCTAEGGVSRGKTTAFLRHCVKCRTPYPKELAACPHCGDTQGKEQDEETLAGNFQGASQSTWSLQLLVELLQRALRLGRAQDVGRILRRAVAQIEEKVQNGEAPPAAQLSSLACACAKAAVEFTELEWALSAIDLYRCAQAVPDREFLTRLIELRNVFPIEVSDHIDKLAADLDDPARAYSDGETEVLAALEALRASRPGSRPRPAALS